MKRIGLLFREKIVEDIKGKLEDSQACFLLSFNKVGASPLNTMRNNLRGCRADLFVTKDSLFRRAFRELNIAELNTFLAAETGAVFVYDENIVGVCKVLVDSSKESETLLLKGGILKDKVITAGEIQDLAKLPPKNVLLAMMLSSLASPLSGFLSALNQVILKFLWVVEEIKKIPAKADRDADKDT